MNDVPLRRQTCKPGPAGSQTRKGWGSLLVPSSGSQAQGGVRTSAPRGGRRALEAGAGKAVDVAATEPTEPTWTDWLDSRY